MAKKIFFFYLDVKIEVDTEQMVGADIKRAIKAEVDDFDPSHELVLEGSGAEPDKPIAEDEIVDLSHGNGHGPQRFFSRAPTNFGR